MKYQQKKTEVYCGKTCIARMYIRHDGENELRILQGLPRFEVMERLAKEVPEFLKEYGISADHYPRLFSEPKKVRKPKKVELTQDEPASPAP